MIKKILFIIICFCSLGFAQKTFKIDTVNISKVCLTDSAGQYLHFFIGGATQLQQFNDSTFISKYPSTTPYLFTIDSFNSFTQDSAMQHGIIVYKNNVMDQKKQFFTNTANQANNFESFIIQLSPGDTLRFAGYLRTRFSNYSTIADTVKSLTLNILRFP